MDSVTKLLEAIAALLGALAWPALLVFIVWRFTPELRKFASNLAQASLKLGPTGLEFSASQRVAEAAAALSAAQAKPAAETGPMLEAPGIPRSALPEGVALPQPRQVDPINVTQALQSVNQATLPRLAGAGVLWVDERPQNNVYERQALQALGIEVVTALSTREALERLGARRWDVIISDMGRPEGPQAGYDLLAQIRQLGFKTPYIIYAGSNRPEHKAEAARRSAFGTTNNPTELFQMVVNAILNPPA